MRERIKRHTISFKNAFSGLFYTVSTQPNFTIHIIASVVVIVTALLLGVTRIEMLVLTFAILLVFIAEMINTTVESVTDLITSEWRTEAKIAKDVAAGMVLLAAIGSVIVGIVIFGGYLIK